MGWIKRKLPEIFASENCEKQGNQLKQGTLTALSSVPQVCRFWQHTDLNEVVSILPYISLSTDWP